MHALLASIALALSLETAAGSSEANTPVSVHEIVLKGTVYVSGSVLNAHTTDYLDRPLTPSDLQHLADELSDACQAEGYLLCRADIPLQDLTDGILSVTMSEGYFDSLSTSPEAEIILQVIFAKVLQERPATERSFREAIALLDDIPGLTIRQITPERVGGGAYSLKINASYDRYGLRGLVTNRGSRRENPWKAFLGGEINSAFRLGDRLSGGVLTRPEVLDELAFYRLRYDFAPDIKGFKPYIEATLSNSSPRSELGGRDVEGSVKSGTAGVKFPLLRQEGKRLDLDISFTHSNSDETEDDLTLFEDRLSIVETSLYYRRRFSNGASFFSAITASAGLDVLDTGGQSRPDGEAEFTKLEFRSDASLQLQTNLLIRAGLHAQAADSPLLFSEEFSFGGGKFGRGYDFGEVLGDHGAAAYLELGRPVRLNGLIRGYEPYLFADVGSTWNEGNGLSADGTVLYSAGGGVKLRGREGWTLNYEAALPLSDAPYTLEDHYVRHRIDLSFSK